MHKASKHLSVLAALLGITSVLFFDQISYAKPRCSSAQVSEILKLQQQNLLNSSLLSKANNQLAKVNIQFNQSKQAGSRNGMNQAQIEIDAAQILVSRYTNAKTLNSRRISDIQAKCDAGKAIKSSQTICTEIENLTLKTIVINFQTQQDLKRLLNSYMINAQSTSQNFSLAPSKRAQAMLDYSRFLQEYQEAITQELYLKKQFDVIATNCESPMYQLPAVFTANLNQTSLGNNGSSSNEQVPRIEKCSDIETYWQGLLTSPARQDGNMDFDIQQGSVELLALPTLIKGAYWCKGEYLAWNSRLKINLTSPTSNVCTTSFKGLRYIDGYGVVSVYDLRLLQEGECKIVSAVEANARFLSPPPRTYTFKIFSEIVCTKNKKLYTFRVHTQSCPEGYVVNKTTRPKPSNPADNVPLKTVYKPTKGTLVVIDSSLQSNLSVFEKNVIEEVCILMWANCPNGSTFMIGKNAAALPSNQMDKNGFDHGTKMTHAAVLTSSSVQIIFIRIVSATTQGNKLATQVDILNQALAWVIENRQSYNISAVAIPMVSGGRFRLEYSDVAFDGYSTLDCPKNPNTFEYLSKLNQLDVPVFVPSGDEGYKYLVSWPGCLGIPITVSASFDGKEASQTNFDSVMTDMFANGKLEVMTVNGQIFPELGSSVATQIAATTYVELKNKLNGPSMLQVLEYMSNNSSKIQIRNQTKSIVSAELLKR